jgi:hypothetical protein
VKIQPGACVIVSLHEPKEKFWGVLEEINAAGAFVRGIDLNSYEELLRMLAHGEEGIYPATIFFPLRRVERVLLDETAGPVQSLVERFEERTGLRLADYLGARDDDAPF